MAGVSLLQTQNLAAKTVAKKVVPKKAEVRNVGKGCWSRCGNKGGACASFCGEDGMCCREGWAADPAECKAEGIEFGKNKGHACVGPPTGVPKKVKEAAKEGDPEGTTQGGFICKSLGKNKICNNAKKGFHWQRKPSVEKCHEICEKTEECRGFIMFPDGCGMHDG